MLLTCLVAITSVELLWHQWLNHYHYYFINQCNAFFAVTGLTSDLSVKCNLRGLIDIFCLWVKRVARTGSNIQRISFALFPAINQRNLSKHLSFCVPTENSV